MEEGIEDNNEMKKDEVDGMSHDAQEAKCLVSFIKPKNTAGGILHLNFRKAGYS